jgi:Coenzyme PQQ synthesis protein D (PqqD)
MNLQSYPQRNEQIIAQKASKDFLLFNMDDGNYYSLNEVGCRIWQLCDGTRSVADIIHTLSAEYDVSTDVLGQDVLEMLEEFRSGKLISVKTPAEAISGSPIGAERNGPSF